MMLSNKLSTRARARRARLLAAAVAIGAIGCRGAEGPAGPPGDGPALVTVAGTASLILDDRTLGYAPVPGLSATVTIPADGATDVLLETDGGIQVNSADIEAFCFIDVALSVDGEQAGSGRRVTVLNTPTVVFSVGSFGLSAHATLAPGVHTVKVVARSITPLAAVPCYVSAGANGSELPGHPQLQGVLNVIAFR